MGGAAKKPTLDEVVARVSTEVYKTTQFFEALETAGLIDGNGHHMRQKVAAFAADLVRERWNEKATADDVIDVVVDALKDDPIFAKAAEIYNKVMGDRIDFKVGTFTVRVWDGMDGCWSDCHEATGVSGPEALLAWMERTESGTKRVSFNEIDYYKIFPSDTRMHWNGAEGREMFRGGEED
jgi:hypothetical protein